MENININTEYIKLDQLMKFSGIAENGSMAKIIITDGVVSVNGETEIRRGRKVYPGDVVAIRLDDGEIVEIAVEKE